MCALPDSYAIPLFVFGAYLISWLIWLGGGYLHGSFHIEIMGWVFDAPQRAAPFLLGNIGPGIAATAVVGLTQGQQGVRALWSALKPRGLSTQWLLFVIVLFPSLVAIALFGYWLLGGKIISTGNPARWILLIVVNLPFAPLWEEIGWRGFLLRRLESKYRGLLASLILASIWAPWHLPLYWNSPFENFVWFVVMIFALSVIFTWVYNRSHGNLVPVVALHAMVNSTNLYLLRPTLQSYGTRPLRFVVGSLVCAAVVIVISEGSGLCVNSLPDLTWPSPPISK